MPALQPPLLLGETSTTAYRGDRGKTAYDHSQLASGNPHNVTKSDVGLGNADNTSDAAKPISTATQAALDAKADLVGGLIPANQLPGFVDDVLEAANFAALPGTGDAGKIYVTLDDNKTYRWSGSAYVEISAGVTLGETAATAYRGDRGKTAYDHSQLASGNPHNVTAADVGLGNVTDDAQLAIANNLGDLADVAAARTNLGLATKLYLTTDQVFTSNTTLANLPGLQVIIPTGQTFEIEYNLYLNQDSAGRLKHRADCGAATPSSFIGSYLSRLNAVLASVVDGSVQTNQTSANTSRGLVNARMVLVNNTGSAITLNVQAAQFASSANATTVYAGSNLIYQRVV